MSKTNETHSGANSDTRVNVRIPSRLAVELQRIADRDANHLSATVRRLLMRGIAVESRDAQALCVLCEKTVATVMSVPNNKPLCTHCVHGVAAYVPIK